MQAPEKLPPPEPKWLLVTCDPKGAGHTYRLAVPGGWLYRTVTYRYPRLHAAVEELGEDMDFLNPKDYLRGEEIVSQTTVFVPEG